jgi:hypothetical protein
VTAGGALSEGGERVGEARVAVPERAVVALDGEASHGLGAGDGGEAEA